MTLLPAWVFRPVYTPIFFSTWLSSGPLGLIRKSECRGRYPRFRTECLFLLKLVLVRLRFAYLGSQGKTNQEQEAARPCSTHASGMCTVRKRLVLVFFNSKFCFVVLYIPHVCGTGPVWTHRSYMATPKFCRTRICPLKPVMFVSSIL